MPGAYDAWNGKGGGRASFVSVGLGDELNVVFDHLEADNGIGGWIVDGIALRKAGRRALRALLKTKISAGANSLHDH